MLLNGLYHREVPKEFTAQLIYDILRADLPDSFPPVSQLSLSTGRHNRRPSFHLPILLANARSRAGLISIPAPVLIESPSVGDYVEG